MMMPLNQFRSLIETDNKCCYCIIVEYVMYVYCSMCVVCN